MPIFAIPDDTVVEVQGEASGVHKAIELIATHLRKFLVDRSVVGIFEKQVSLHFYYLAFLFFRHTVNAYI